MDEDTKKIIKKKFDRLPESIKELILSSNYENTLIEIGRKYNLTVEQMGMLEKETTMVMMGLIPIKDFQEDLTRELQVSQDKGFQITTDINEKIFLRIRELLKIMNSEEKLSQEEGIKANNEIEEKKILSSAGIEILNGNTSTPPQNGTPEEGNNPLPVPEKLELNSPLEEYSVPKTEGGGKMPESVPPMLSQKLSETVKTQQVKTEHSVENITKAPEPNKEAETKKYTIDPYRELPE